MESKRLGKLLCVIGTALIAAAIGATLVQAEAPAPQYRQFAGCPSPKTENPEISSCIRVFIPSGYLRLGKKELPISSPVAFSGGINSSGGGFSTGSRGGLTSVKQLVPGGLDLAGLSAFSSKANPQLSMMMELAGHTSFESLDELRLPVKIHLFSPVLTDSCYIGSNANPLQLRLVTGTTSPPPPVRPITGQPLTDVNFDPVTEIITATGGMFVDNAFAIPSATGCVLRPFSTGLSINGNGVINSAMGLAARPGASELRLNFGFELVEASLVYP
jgi:hypothetical protein